MKTISVRELRSVIPHLGETLAKEHELVLMSHGEPVARILPIEAASPRLESLEWLRALAPARSPAGSLDSTVIIREERDRRGT